MTVLTEDTAPVIMTSGLGGDRYITPEYLAPLPQKDGLADKSPLQLLAQTCSQIGADSGPGAGAKLSADKVGKMTGGKANTKPGSPPIVVSDAKPVPFKPYENTKDGAGAKSVESKRLSETGSSKSSSPVQPDSRSPRDNASSESNRHATKSASPKQSTSSSVSSDAASTTPIMSSGLEILAGHPKDLPLGTFRPGPASLLDLNPAFRLPSSIPGLPCYPGHSPGPGGSVCRDPYCKDPSCPTFVYNAYMASARMRLPPGYLELLEAHKLASLGASRASPPGPLPPSPSLPPTSLSASASLGPGGPYICNWMHGRDYCGKRYSSAEELLVHLKTHTNLAVSGDLTMPGAGAGPAYAGLLSQSLMRGGAASQLLPSALSLQASRYSPYQRPGAALPPSLSSLSSLSSLAPGGLPPSPMGALPPSLASGLPYPASLYALYGARL